jgi:hypothetical protein
MRQIQRDRYGQFGIASTYNSLTGLASAWACIGDTVGANAMEEPTEPVWFQYGATPTEAIELLKAELDRVEAPPGRVVLLNGVRYMVYGVAHGAGTSRRGEIVVYADMDTGRMFYRTRANFADRMGWNVVDQ